MPGASPTRSRIAAVLAIVAASPSLGHAQGAACAPPAARAPDVALDNGTRTVVAQGQTPCQITMRPTTLLLRTDAEGTIEGIGQRVVRLPTGGYVTSFRERIQFWSATGQPLQQHGRRGTGPGEMSIGAKLIFPRGDTLWIRDGVMVHAMLPDGQVLGSHAVSAPMVAFQSTVLLADGRLLTAGVGTSGSAAGQHFHLTTLRLAAGVNAAPVVSFGPVTAEESAVGLDAPRALGYVGGQTFWAGPAWMPASGYYELEQWNTAGQRIQRLRRSAPWFVGGRAGARQLTDRPPPAVAFLQPDSAGVLWVGTAVPSSQWDPRAAPDSAYSIRVDAIRVSDGLLLGTLGPMIAKDAMATLPSSFFTGSRFGARLEEDEDGLQVARIVELRLEARR
jgi:hypothetical protein